MKWLQFKSKLKKCNVINQLILIDWKHNIYIYIYIYILQQVFGGMLYICIFFILIL